MAGRSWRIFNLQHYLKQNYYAFKIYSWVSILISRTKLNEQQLSIYLTKSLSSEIFQLWESFEGHASFVVKKEYAHIST